MVGVMPAMGEIRMPPFSVCHHVSTMGAFPLPIFSLYQFQASSLIGSPTLPSLRILLRSLLSTYSSPAAINDRMAVGAVYRIFTLCLSTTSQKRPASGQVGMPSNINEVAPCDSGP